MVEYKKGCDNRVADALSQTFGLASSSDSKASRLMLLTVPDPTWLKVMQDSYSLD